MASTASLATAAQNLMLYERVPLMETVQLGS